jgi:hypothetical protein
VASSLVFYSSVELLLLSSVETQLTERIGETVRCSSMHFCVQNTKEKQKLKYKNLLHEAARFWISEVQNRNESFSDELLWPDKAQTPREHKQNTPSRLSEDFNICQRL